MNEKPMIAMCWKCVDGLWADDLSMKPQAAGQPKLFMGCKKDSRINGKNRNELCPILPCNKK